LLKSEARFSRLSINNEQRGSLTKLRYLRVVLGVAK